MKRFMSAAALAMASLLVASAARAESNWTSKDRDEIYRVIREQAEESRRGPSVTTERYYDLSTPTPVREPARRGKRRSRRS